MLLFPESSVQETLNFCILYKFEIRLEFIQWDFFDSKFIFSWLSKGKCIGVVKQNTALYLVKK